MQVGMALLADRHEVRPAERDRRVIDIALVEVNNVVYVPRWTDDPVLEASFA